MLWDCATIHHGFYYLSNSIRMQGFTGLTLKADLLYIIEGPGGESTHTHTHKDTHTSYLTIHHSAADTAVALHNTAACRLSITQWFDFFRHMHNVDKEAS